MVCQKCARPEPVGSVSRLRSIASTLQPKAPPQATHVIIFILMILTIFVIINIFMITTKNMIMSIHMICDTRSAVAVVARPA